MTTQTKSQRLAELRKLAEAAKVDAGEWKWDGRTVDEDGYVYIPECSYLVGNVCLSDQYEGYQDHCDFIAAANPATIIELLDYMAAQDEALTAAREALLQCARMAEALKKDCGMDPESPQAVRNSQYMSISYAAHAALSTIKEVQ